MSTVDYEALIGRMYDAFNRRDVDAVVASMTEEVVWANGMDGGHVHGKLAVREYWARQFEVLNPTVTAEEIEVDGSTVRVRVHQHIVEIASGATVADSRVGHVYQFEGPLVARFDIEEPDG